jgi:hypothetical protein
MRKPAHSFRGKSGDFDLALFTVKFGSYQRLRRRPVGFVDVGKQSPTRSPITDLEIVEAMVGDDVRFDLTAPISIGHHRDPETPGIPKLALTLV